MSKSKRHVFLDPENLQGKNANPHVDLMEVTCATHFGLHINWANQADRGVHHSGQKWEGQGEGDSPPNFQKSPYLSEIFTKIFKKLFKGVTMRK